MMPDGSVRFRLWAPAVRQVELILENGAAKEIILPMRPIADGWFQIEISRPQAAPGTLYHYRLDGGLLCPIRHRVPIPTMCTAPAK